MNAYSTLTRKELVDALEEHVALSNRLSDILTQTVNALKGEPAPLRRHSWHDLPDLARAAVQGRSRENAATDSEISELAHRTCSTYMHGEQPSYVFEPHTLQDFAQKLLGDASQTFMRLEAAAAEARRNDAIAMSWISEAKHAIGYEGDMPGLIKALRDLRSAHDRSLQLEHALREVKGAIEFTPLGVRGIKALDAARAALGEMLATPKASSSETLPS